MRFPRTNQSLFSVICFGPETKGSPTQTVSWHPRHSRRKRPPPLILEEDALCSEHSGENLWQHQRVVERFSNRSANERRPSCTSVITAASLRGELISCAQLWSCCLWELVSYTELTFIEDQVCQRWVTGLKHFSADFWSCERTIISGFYCKILRRYGKHVERRLHVKSVSN